MDAPTLNVSELWDADAYRRARNVPWTFFVYPRILADDQRLPRDAESVRFLEALHKTGVRVGIWGDNMFPKDYYYACPKDDIRRLHDEIAKLEQRGDFPERFWADRSEYLLSLVADSINSPGGV